MVTINANEIVPSKTSGLVGETGTQLTEEQARLLNYLLDALQKLQAKYHEQQELNQLDTAKVLKSLKPLLAMQKFFTEVTYQEKLAKLPLASVLSVQAETYSFIGEAYQKIHAGLGELALQTEAQISQASGLLDMAAEAQVQLKAVETSNNLTQSESEASVEGGESEAGTKRWTKASVTSLVREKLAPSAFGGKPGRLPTAIVDERIAVECVRMLGRYGPMTGEQLCSFLTLQSGIELARKTLISEVYRALRLLQLQKLIQPVKTRCGKTGGRPQNLWFLEKPGSLYYQILIDEEMQFTGSTLTGEGTASDREREAAQIRGQSEHVWGIQEVLSGLNMLVAANQRRLIKATFPPASNPNPISVSARELGLGVEVELHLEIAQWPVYLTIKKEERQRVQPDGMGRFLYQLEVANPHKRYLQTEPGITEAPANTILATTASQLETQLLGQANIDPELEEGRFSRFGSAVGSITLAWPFLLEYDRSTEGLASFGGKYGLYARLMNILATGWPTGWGDKFPIILVVVDGTANRVVALQQQIRQQLRADKLSRKKPTGWWFTRLDWFRRAGELYQEQGRLGSGREGEQQELQLNPGQIWLPLHQQITPVQLREVDYYLAGNKAKGKIKVKIKEAATDVISSVPEALTKLSALPIPARLY